MHNSFPLTRSSLRSIKDSVSYGHKVMWAGWAGLGLLLVGTIVFFYLWKLLLSTLITRVLAVLPLPAGEEAKFTILLVVSGVFFLGFVLWIFSYCWLQIDYRIWREGTPRERLLAKIAPVFMATLQIVAYLLGFGVLAWVLDTAVAARLEGSLQNADLVVTAALAALFLPLWIRLWFLPATATLEADNAAGPWRVLLQTSNRRGFDLLVAVLIQLGLLGLILFTFNKFMSSLAGPMFEVITSGKYTAVPEFADALQSKFSVEVIQGFVAWALVAGPLLLLLASMQIAVVRSLVGVPREGGDGAEEHIALNDAGNLDGEEEKEEDGPSDTDPDEEPKYAFEVPEPPAEEESAASVPAPQEEEGELPEEILAAAQAEEESLNRSSSEPPPIADPTPPLGEPAQQTPPEAPSLNDPLAALSPSDPAPAEEPASSDPLASLSPSAPAEEPASSDPLAALSPSASTSAEEPSSSDPLAALSPSDPAPAEEPASSDPLASLSPSESAPAIEEPASSDPLAALSPTSSGSTEESASNDPLATLSSTSSGSTEESGSGAPLSALSPSDSTPAEEPASSDPLAVLGGSGEKLPGGIELEPLDGPVPEADGHRSAQRALPPVPPPLPATPAPEATEPPAPASPPPPAADDQAPAAPQPTEAAAAETPPPLEPPDLPAPESVAVPAAPLAPQPTPSVADAPPPPPLEPPDLSSAAEQQGPAAPPEPLRPAPTPPASDPPAPEPLEPPDIPPPPSKLRSRRPAPPKLDDDELSDLPTPAGLRKRGQ